MSTHAGFGTPAWTKLSKRSLLLFGPALQRARVPKASTVVGRGLCLALSIRCSALQFGCRSDKDP